MNTKRKFTPEFKTQVVMDALQEKESITVLAQKYTLAAEQINKWKREFKANASLAFTAYRPSTSDIIPNKEVKLNKIIEQQKVEIEFLKKVLSLT
jgi:transposase